MAEPGEFSRRAFLNGRMDLTQAEGLFDLIRARSDRAAQAALEQLEGVLSRSFNGLYDAFGSNCKSGDYAGFCGGRTAGDDVFSGIAQKLDYSFTELDKLLETWNEGRLIREGVRVAILGRPKCRKINIIKCVIRI